MKTTRPEIGEKVTWNGYAVIVSKLKYPAMNCRGYGCGINSLSIKKSFVHCRSNFKFVNEN